MPLFITKTNDLGLMSIENQNAFDENQLRETQCLEWLKAQKKPVRKLINLTALIGIISGILMMIQTALFAHILHQLVIEQQLLQGLMVEFILLGLVFILRSLCGYYFPVIGFKIAEQVKRSVREQLLEQFSKQGVAFCKQQQTGALAVTTLEHTEALEHYFSRYLPQQLIVSVLPLLMIAIVIPVNWVVAVIFLVTGPLIPLFMALVGMGAASANRNQFLIMAKMNGYFLDRLQGLTTLKLFAQAEAELQIIQKISHEFRERTMDVLRIAFLSSAVLEFFSAVAVALVAVYVGLGLLGLIHFGPAVNISFQEAMFVLLLAPEFFNPLKQLSSYYHDKAAAVGAADKLLKVLQQPLIESLADQGFTQSAEMEFSVELQNVSKSYQKKQVLKSLSLQIKAGEKIALTGESGIGKTTVFNLLLGFEQATSGQVLINAAPASEQNTIKNIAWAGQQSNVFYASIKDNISLLDPTFSEQQITLAAELAGVTKYSQYLPKGLLTIVGEKGFGLSGGQVQRIVLARAFIKETDIILLDEPTAHLDSKTKTNVLDVIDLLFKGKTLIIASHDPQVIARMDRVINLS